MRWIVFAVVYLALLSLAARGQEPARARYTGLVLDAGSREPIPLASVVVRGWLDTIKQVNILTDVLGQFVLADRLPGTGLYIKVTAKGYEDYSKTCNLKPAQLSAHTDTFLMRRVYTKMEDVVVIAHRPAFRMKGDTMEYSADALANPFSNELSDLLRRIPGATLDAGGFITIQGRRVSKITVNGKDLYGKDYSVITRFFTKEMVDKIEVFDEKSSLSPVSMEKVINIVLKKKAVGKLFGKVYGGGGNSGRFEAGSNLQYFKEDVQFGVAGGADNTSNYLGEEANPVSAAGDWRRRYASLQGGKDMGKGFSLNGGYQFNGDATQQQEILRRQNFLTDTLLVQHSSLHFDQQMNEHKGSLSLQSVRDSSSHWQLAVSGRSLSSAYVTMNSGDSRLVDGKPVADSRNALQADRRLAEVNADFSGYRKVGKHGDKIGWGMVYNLSRANESSYNKGQTLFYDTGSVSGSDSFDLAGSNRTRNSQASWMVSWSHPIGRGWSLELAGSGSLEAALSNKANYQYNEQTSRYDVMDPLLSDQFQTTIRTQVLNVAINYSVPKFKALLGAGQQWLQQRNESKTRKEVNRYTDNRVIPVALVTYLLDSRSSLYFAYSGQTQRFTMEQVQPVVDVSNPLFKRIGNPDLVLPFAHNLDLSFTNAKQTRMWSLGVKYSTINNKINDHTWFDGVQYSQPVNTRENNSGMGYFNYANLIKKEGRTISITFGSSGRLSRASSLLQFKNITSRSIDLSNNLNVGFSVADRFSVAAQYANFYLATKTLSDVINKVQFFRQSIGLSVFTNWPRSLVLVNQFSYTLTSQTNTGTPARYLLWNLSGKYRPFKKGKLSLKASLYDVLGQNNSFVRVAGPGFVDDIQKQVQSRFFLVGLQYDLSPRLEREK